MIIDIITSFNSKLDLLLRTTFLLVLAVLLLLSSGCNTTTSTVKGEGQISPNLLRPEPVEIPQKTKMSMPFPKLP